MEREDCVFTFLGCNWRDEVSVSDLRGQLYESDAQRSLRVWGDSQESAALSLVFSSWSDSVPSERYGRRVRIMDRTGFDHAYDVL